MGKPVMKREVEISAVIRETGIIHVCATQDAATEFGAFGDVFQMHGSLYHLQVDPRYDFSEVEMYIKNYGKEGGEPTA